MQRTAGHVQPLGRLTLGDTLGVQLIIPRKQVRAFEARPVLMTIFIATLLGLALPLLPPIPAFRPTIMLAKDGRGTNLDTVDSVG